jgi:predicted amidophosphoribosyltransferase
VNNKECSYCGRAWEEHDGACAHCGAPVKLNGIAKYDPYFYEGYIVYSIRDWSRRTFQFIFYQGATLKGNIHISDYEIMNLPPTEDYMPLVMARLDQS